VGVRRCLARLSTPVEEASVAGQLPSATLSVAQSASEPAPRSVPIGLPVILGTGCLVGFAAVGLTWQLRRRRRGRVESLDEEGLLGSVTPVQRKCLFEKRQRILGIFRQDMAAVLRSQVEVRHVMSTRLVTVGPLTPAGEIRGLMSSQRMRHLLVCDDEGNLLGIVSDRDLKQRKGKSASALMTRRPLTISPESPVSTAITLMLDRHISCLPVVKDDVLMGVLTSTDLMMALQCTLKILGQLAAELKDAGKQASPAAGKPEALSLTQSDSP
jgi:acetoin utilization protein AcuB